VAQPAEHASMLLLLLLLCAGWSDATTGNFQGHYRMSVVVLCEYSKFRIK